MDSPDCLLTLLSICVFLLFSFSVFHFLVVGSVRLTKLTHVGFRAHVKIASRIVSYRIVQVSAVADKPAQRHRAVDRGERSEQ